MKIGTNYENKQLLVNRVKEENGKFYAHVNKELQESKKRVNYWIDITEAIFKDENDNRLGTEPRDLTYSEDWFVFYVTGRTIYILASFF